MVIPYKRTATISQFSDTIKQVILVGAPKSPILIAEFLWLLNSIVCLDYLPFGCDVHILILFTYQHFQSNLYFILQSLPFTFKEVYYFFPSISFIVCFPSWSYFVCFWWSVILCFWDRVYLHSPGYPGTLYVNHTCCELREILLPLPSMYWN